MGKDIVYLDNCMLQQDMRIRLPKSIIKNLDAEKGKTSFAVYLDLENKQLILKIEGKKGVQDECKD